MNRSGESKRKGGAEQRPGARDETPQNNSKQENASDRGKHKQRDGAQAITH